MSIVFGLWPLAGITTIGVTGSDADATIAAAIECGINRFDTAFSYGYDGELRTVTHTTKVARILSS